MRKWTMVMVAALLLGSVMAEARPGEDASTAEAKQHYLSGMAHFNLQEYPQAISEFEAAYRLKPDPVFLYNLGQTYRLSNNAERALYFYQAYLRSAPDAPNRAEVEGRIANLEKLMSDQKSIATPPDHTIAPGEKPPAQAARPAPATAPQAAATTSPATAANDRAPAERTPIYKKWWLWTIVGAVAAGAAVGIAVGVTESSPSFGAGLGTVGPAALQMRY